MTNCFLRSFKTILNIFFLQKYDFIFWNKPNSIIMNKTILNIFFLAFRTAIKEDHFAFIRKTIKELYLYGYLFFDLNKIY
jgi:hypothetical protein